ncbi:hypothetical protein KAR91_69765 [Candidatus Pacearchaeota archaeon]|nr:hypothetical protein [Candidatus Pacearchaeota archaeon]
MKAQEFFTGIQKYYGSEYLKGIQKDAIGSWLIKKTERYLGFLYKEVLKSFPGQYGKLPDIAVFESLETDVYYEMDREEQIADMNRPCLPLQPDEDDRQEECSAILDKLNAKIHWRKRGRYTDRKGKEDL